MTELPLEILQLISQHLHSKDVTQFQLVSRKWQKASTETLYSTVELNGEQVVWSFADSIYRYRILGAYIKTIIIFNFFEQENGPDLLGQKDFLKLLIKNCPNLREIRCKLYGILWVDLTLAGIVGQLANLQCLPTNNDMDMAPYLCAALSFKRSLTYLNLYDFFDGNFETIDKDSFQYLRSRISEFPRLQHLTITCNTNKPFSDLDAIIEDCPRLITLDVAIYADVDLEETKRQDILVLPRPNIRKLTIAWIDDYFEAQLRYMMRKFPNLQYLNIYDNELIPPPGISNISADVLLDFISYISKIVNLKMNIITTREDLIKYWNNFIKLRKDLLKVCISYLPPDEELNVIINYNKNLLNITCMIKNSDTILPHEDFLRENGDMIKALDVELNLFTYLFLDETSVIKRDILCNEAWIIKILQLCPSLQELTISDLKTFKLSGNNEYRHTELKKLIIYDNGEESATAMFLKNISINVPNLKQLFLSYRFREYSKEDYCIEIDMPNTSFDIIIVKFKRVCELQKNHYLALNICDKKRYFIAGNNGAYELNHTSYHQSEKRYQFKIICSDLKQFKLIQPYIRSGKEVDIETNMNFISLK